MKRKFGAQTHVGCCNLVTRTCAPVEIACPVCFVTGRVGAEREFALRMAFRSKSLGGVLVAVALLGGCANEGGSNDSGDPGAKPLAAGQTCQSVRAELNKLDAKGAQSKVEAASQGKKLPPAQQAEVDRYNELLNQYLGARCHV